MQPNDSNVQHGEPEIYLPFAAAVEMGILDPAAVTTHTPHGAVDLLRAGIMPPEGGVVDLHGEPAAFDLLTAAQNGKDIHVLPTAKAAVDPKTDHIVMPGQIVFWPTPERLKVIGRTLTSERAVWVRPQSGVYRTAGRVACQFYGLDSPEFDVQEVTDAGLVIATPRRRYF